MSTSSVNALSGNYLQSILNAALQSAGQPAAGSTTSAGSASSVGQSADSNQLSPFAQLASTLQQLQQSNPAEYKQVTGQIAANLQTAAQTAQSQGNTTAATQLNQLATDFTNASGTGQLPNLQDLAQAVGGSGHHHHHHAHAASSDSGSDSSSSSSTASSATSSSQSLSQLLATLESSGSSSSGSQTTNNSALNPLDIILNTLQTAGIAG